MKSQISPRQFSDAIGVSESSVKRWIDSGRIPAVRTAGGHRRIAIAEAARFIREAGMPVFKPQVLGLADSGLKVPGDDQSVSAQLKAALLAGLEGRAKGILQSIYLSGRTVAEIGDCFVAPAMSEIGEIWAHDPRGIYLEHRATQICVQALNELRRLIPDPPADAPLAVGGAPSGDPYLIPTLLAGLSLLEAGWRIQNLGPDTPLESLALAAKENGAALVWLSVSGAHDRLEKEIEHLSEELAARNAVLVVGGRALDWPAAAMKGTVHLGTSMSELRSYASGMEAARV